jgi:hypothetical protein
MSLIFDFPTETCETRYYWNSVSSVTYHNMDNNDANKRVIAKNVITKPESAKSSFQKKHISSFRKSKSVTEIPSMQSSQIGFNTKSFTNINIGSEPRIKFCADTKYKIKFPKKIKCSNSYDMIPSKHIFNKTPPPKIFRQRS